MKFKGFLTEGGATLLEKRFIPALEKTGGKTCHLYLTPTHIFFLSNDAVQSVAEFTSQTLFSDYRISSQSDNRIAFTLDLSLLLRALRSAAAISTVSDQLQLKLVKKLPPHCTIPMPFLTFETKGFASAVVQDVPISKPLSRVDLAELKSQLDRAQELPKTLVGVRELERLQAFVERMKQLGDVMEVKIAAASGELGLKVSTTLVTLGAQFERLAVVGGRESGEVEDGGGDGEEELSVLVNMKHFAKCLQCHLAKPDCAFYGVEPRGGSLAVVFQFFIPGSRQTDKSMSLHCRLPVLDPGS